MNLPYPGDKWLVCLLAALLWVASPATAQDPAGHVVYERWFALTMQEQPVGWAQELVREEAGRITTSSRLAISLRRGAATVGIEISSDFIETDDGRAIMARTVQKLAGTQVVQTMRFGADGIHITTVQNGQTQQSMQPSPPAEVPWLAPAAAARHVERQIAVGADTIELWTIEPLGGAQPLKMTLKRQGEHHVEVLGKIVPATLWHIVSSMAPGMVTRSYTDERGRNLKTRVTLMPGMELVMIEADEVLAKAQVNPPEMVLSTLVRPDKPIARPRQARWAVYELHLTPPEDAEEDFQFELPRGGSQRVAWGERHVARVAVNLDDPVNPRDDLPTQDHRRPSVMVNSDDPAVRALLVLALDQAGENPSAAEKAERLRRFVHDYIDAKDLSVGFATASEVARTAQGDCSEHAVLLAALLRAAEIPSRTVSGLVYVEQFLGQAGVFGYHMWTQAWLDGGNGGRWVDLDATLDHDTPNDATHIALAHSALMDGTMYNDMVTMMPMLGRLSIRVIAVGYDRQE